MKDRIADVYMMNACVPPWYVRLLLRFVKLEEWRGEETTMQFKQVLGTMYVYQIIYRSRIPYNNLAGKYN